MSQVLNQANNINVLIFTADEIVADECKNKLEKEDFILDLVENFSTAQQLIATNNYKAVIVDFLLPNATSIEVVRDIKAISSNIIVIVIAEEIDENLLLKVMQVGASYCLPKIEGYFEQLPYLIRVSLEQQQAFEKTTQKSINKSNASNATLEYKGQLSNTTIPKLLRAFYQQQLTGALHITREGLVTSFYFIDGSIVYVGSKEPDKLLGEKLVKEGKISQQDLEAITNLMSKSKNRFAAAITSLGLLKPEELKPLLVQHILKQLYSTFEWAEGDFVFEPGAKLENEVMLSLSTADVIFAGIRHLKNRKLIEKWLGDFEQILIPTSDLAALFQALTLNPNEIKVIEKIDRPMSIEQICEVSQLDEEIVLRTLSGLIETGMLVPFAAKAEKLLVEIPKFVELFDFIPLQGDFDARSAAEFCYEMEMLLQKFRFCDHYAVLDVGRKSSKTQITEAFRELAKKFHPDRHDQLASYHLNLRSDLKTIFERLAEAYYTLSDDSRRSAYDITLKPISTIAKGTGNFVEGKVTPPVEQALPTTRPLPPVIPGLLGSEEYEVALEFYQKRHFDKARQMLLEAVDADPDNAEYQVALARSMVKLPAYIRQAETAYLRAIELSPRNAEYCAELGLFYQKFSHTSQARAMFRRTLELDPNNPIALRVNM
ncbi:MAG: DUF4388 domain-containing protein [Blastocatellia bacterium]